MIKKTKLMPLLLCMILISVKANATDNPRYQQTVFHIENQTGAPVLMTIRDQTGVWKNWVNVKTPVILGVNAIYENTLQSVKKNKDFENFASITVSDFVNKNYLIFAENSSSKNEWVTADIMDGRGTLFIDSRTNDCNENTPKGYAFCTLIIKNDAAIL